MKKYSQPKARKVRVISSIIMVCSYTGGYDGTPKMGTDETIAGSGAPTMGNDAKRHWKDF